jgi:DNA-binding CsgD family transcriptional regulator/PAS domain-containing protein
VDHIDLIGGVYDAVIEPDRWHGAVDAIRERFNFHNAMMTVFSLPMGSALVNLSVNVPVAYAGMNGPEYSEDILRLWGGAERVAQLPLEEPVILSEQGDSSLWPSSRYYNDFAKPQGIIDVIAIGLARDRTMLGNLAFGLHESGTKPPPRDRDGLRMLGPHLRRAALISGILGQTEQRASSFEATLDVARSGVILVDASMAIVHANRAGQTMLALGDPVRERLGRLELRQELLPGQLKAAVAACDSDADLGRRGIGIPTRRLDGSPLIVHVMPLEQRSIRGGLPANASAAIFIADGSGGIAPMHDALGLLFGLTPAEARVFELVVDGLENDGVALALGVAPSTVKTHLLRVFDKTGAHSRTGLVSLARQISPNL